MKKRKKRKRVYKKVFKQGVEQECGASRKGGSPCLSMMTMLPSK